MAEAVLSDSVVRLSLLVITRRRRWTSGGAGSTRPIRKAGRLRGILRPAYPDLEDRASLVAALRALAAAGVREVAFYNWGHVRARNFEAIAEGLAAMESAT